MSEAPLLLVSGSDDFRRERLVRQVLKRRVSTGWNSETIQGDDPGLETALATIGVLFAEKRVIVVQHPEKASLPILRDQLDNPNRDVLLVLNHEGEIKSSSLFHKNFVSKLPSGVTQNFTEVPSYKATESAYQFVQEEVKSLGYQIGEDIALMLVLRMGSDLGILSFEILKASLLTKPGEFLTINTFKATMAPLLDLGGQPLMDAISSGNLKVTLAELRRVQLYGGSDPTIRICGAYLAPAFLRWLAAVHLHQSGVSSKSAAERASANPWYWENKVLPPALRWGYKGCRMLVESVAEAQSSVFRGALSPWNLLETGLIRAFRAKA